jgi:hypothetical protein
MAQCGPQKHSYACATDYDRPECPDVVLKSGSDLATVTLAGGLSRRGGQAYGQQETASSTQYGRRGCSHSLGVVQGLQHVGWQKH